MLETPWWIEFHSSPGLVKEQELNEKLEMDEAI
jgi:hypothetical protein